MIMSTEKIIKQQAKHLLNGNWSIIIAATVFVCVIPIALFTFSDFICVLTGVYNDNGELIQNMQAVYQLINGIAVTILLFLSPAVNGLVKMFCNTALYGKTKMSDLFLYFSNKTSYFTTFIFNMIIISVAFTLGYGLDVYNYTSQITGCTIDGTLEFNYTTVLLAASMLISVIIKIFIYFIFVHYPLIAYSTFDNLPVTKCIFSMYAFSLRHLGQTLKLAFGFIGWAALCFFVVPAFYVFPYVITSACVSAKWLFLLDRDRGVLC